MPLKWEWATQTTSGGPTTGVHPGQQFTFDASAEEITEEVPMREIVVRTDRAAPSVPYQTPHLQDLGTVGIDDFLGQRPGVRVDAVRQFHLGHLHGTPLKTAHVP